MREIDGWKRREGRGATDGNGLKEQIGGRETDKGKSNVYYRDRKGG